MLPSGGEGGNNLMLPGVGGCSLPHLLPPGLTAGVAARIEGFDPPLDPDGDAPPGMSQVHRAPAVHGGERE